MRARLSADRFAGEWPELPAADFSRAQQPRRTFDEVSKEAGLTDLPLKSRRGAAFGDIFNTGNVDVVLVNVGEPPTLLLNQNSSPNHRVLFKLVGTKSNRAAIGARVTIHADGVRQMGEVRGGNSYLSQNDLRLHFGLGKSTKSSR